MHASTLASHPNEVMVASSPSTTSMSMTRRRDFQRERAATIGRLLIHSVRVRIKHKNTSDGSLTAINEITENVTVNAKRIFIRGVYFNLDKVVELQRLGSFVP